VTALPPLSVGAAQVTRDAVLVTAALPITGAPGTAGVGTELNGVENVPTPTTLIAATLNT